MPFNPLVSPRLPYGKNSEDDGGFRFPFDFSLDYYIEITEIIYLQAVYPFTPNGYVQWGIEVCAMWKEAMNNRPRKILYTVCLLLFLAACDQSTNGPEIDADSTGKPFQCDHDNGGLTLPPGFCAAIVADNLGFVRHIAVNINGDIYATQRNHYLNLGGLLALRDADGDGRIDEIERINDKPGMGIGIHSGYLYFASDHALYRYRLERGKLLPSKPPEVIVTDFPEQKLHAGKTFTFDQDGSIYVNIGSPSNACQLQDLVPLSRGMDPCPQLDLQSGIWRFDANRAGQTHKKDGYRYASGVRNAYAIDWNLNAGKLYIVQHGRDQLRELWPELFTNEKVAQLPAEEFLLIEEGGEYSWPYCYFDQIDNKRMLSPEYGGDGLETGRCSQFPDPLIAFPGHYGPNDLIFYHADQFPEKYRKGAFIAFHSGYFNNDNKRIGYHVVFIPFNGAMPAGEWEVFADGFAGKSVIATPSDAEHRPTGLAIGADGSLYISDSVQGRIWRVIYKPH
ncbi:MAG: PQQ-dependent sugar dehydrogenase [Gammaproteobacteria bacterium]